MTFLGIATAETRQSFTSFFPTFLVEYRGLSLPDASLLFGVVFLLSAVTQAFYGRLSDRMRRETVIAVVLSTAAVDLGAIIVADSFRIVLLGVAMTGFGFGWGGVFQSRFMDLYTDEERGTAYGLVPAFEVLRRYGVKTDVRLALVIVHSLSGRRMPP